MKIRDVIFRKRKCINTDDLFFLILSNKSFLFRGPIMTKSNFEINYKLRDAIWKEQDELKAVKMISENFKYIDTLTLHWVDLDYHPTNFSDDYSGSIMHLAVRRNMPNALRLLLQVDKLDRIGYNVFPTTDRVDDEDKTLIRWAVELGLTKIVEILCQERHIFDCDGNDDYLLNITSETGNLEVVELLLLYHRDELKFSLYRYTEPTPAQILIEEFDRNPKKKRLALKAKYPTPELSACVFALNLLIQRDLLSISQHVNNKDDD